jgi:hypothetical protein
MFPFRKKTDAAPFQEPPETSRSWLQSVLTLCVVLVLIAGMIEVYRRVVDRYATKVVETQSEKIAVSARLMDMPKWLHPDILKSIVGETAALAGRDAATYDRFRNPLDQDILREIHDNYVGTDQNGVNHWAQGNNAWIKKITKIERVISPDRKSQVIEIFAEYRQPAAWIESGGKYYLIDPEFVRLPGEFSLEERKAASKLMLITGVDLPHAENAAPALPVPSAPWNTDDVAAAMKLVPLLKDQPYADQVLAIDMTNFEGRKDRLQSWILLRTDRPAADGTPSCVMWGRTPGKSTFYEVSDAAKLKALSDLFMRFNRIDADHDYVDIRTEQVRLPKLATQADPTPAASAHG